MEKSLLTLKEILQIRKNLGKNAKENLKDVLSYDKDEVFALIISKAPKKEKLDRLIIEHKENENVAIKIYLEELISFVFKILHKKRFSAERIKETMSQRSAFELILDWDVHYANACFDYTLLTTVILQKLWFENVKFIIDFIWSAWILHFWTEFSYKNKPYYVDSHSYNTMFIWAWEFISKYDHEWPVSAKEKIDWKDINEHTKIFDFEKYITEENLKKIFSVGTLNYKIKKLIEDNKDWTDRTDKYIPTLKKNYSTHIENKLTNEEILTTPIIERADRKHTTN